MHVLATGQGLEVAAELGLPVIVGGPLLGVAGDPEPGLAALAAYRRAFRPSDRSRLGELLERTGAAELVASSSTFDRAALAASDGALVDLLGSAPCAAARASDQPGVTASLSSANRRWWSRTMARVA